VQIRQVFARFQNNIFTSSFYQKYVGIGNFNYLVSIIVKLSSNLCNTLQHTVICMELELHCVSETTPLKQSAY